VVTKIKNAIDSYRPDTIMVHSDIVKASGFVTFDANSKIWLNKHIEILEQFCDRELIFASFNYDFLKNGVYRPENDVVQIGVLNEFARKNWATWRSLMPVFNVLGKNKIGFLENILNDDVLDPFDELSIFGYLYKKDALILQYGAPFSSFTGIHYVENLSSRPPYRYDKYFKGTIAASKFLNKNIKITLNYHVRPLGINLNYDWDRLYKISLKEGIIKQFTGRRINVNIFSFKEIVDFLLDKVRDDKLFLLNTQSKNTVEPLLDKLGRRFVLSDFEVINE
jgi:aminoglycoside N3'-acetyltransferase